MDRQLTHAGGVVFRRENGETLYLIVSSSDGQSWVLPKGHIEPGESPDATAVREIAEEAGVVGKVVASLSVRPFMKSGREALAQYFLIIETGMTETIEGRKIRWENEQAALELLTFPEAKAAISEGAAKLG
jgi:8-oxo-dGTP pyrophosphatase MutT (NUDIX family)